MRKWLFWVGSGWMLAAFALGAAPCLCAQEGVADAPRPKQPAKILTLPDRLVEKPSRAPVASIALEPLGFSVPSNVYIGQRFSFVSLDFLDESHLLLTFRVPGLIHRNASERDAGEYEERQIRAMVLSLPSGAVEAEALWTVHDHERYVWMLGDGHFFLRDRENLELGDKSLVLKPFLRFPGALLALEMDPEQKILLTYSREAEKTHPTGETEDEPRPESDSPIAVRVLQRDSGKVLLSSRARAALRLPFNSEGYLEVMRAASDRWLLQMKYFSGGSRVLGQAASGCVPSPDFLSQRELLLTSCSESGADLLTAMTLDGKRLWEAQTSEAMVWPLVVRGPNGLRMAREALEISHPVTSIAPLSQDEIKGQVVEILDAADGKVVLEASASPILDGGGNVAISPSGQRVAVLNGGAIQLFELPAPPALPGETAPLSTH